MCLLCSPALVHLPPWSHRPREERNPNKATNRMLRLLRESWWPWCFICYTGVWHRGVLVSSAGHTSCSSFNLRNCFALLEMLLGKHFITRSREFPAVSQDQRSVCVQRECWQTLWLFKTHKAENIYSFNKHLPNAYRDVYLYNMLRLY